MSDGYNEAMFEKFDRARTLLDHIKSEYELRPPLEADEWLDALADQATGLSYGEVLELPVGAFDRIQIEYAIELARRPS